MIDALIRFVRACARCEARANAVYLLGTLMERSDRQECVSLVLDHDLDGDERGHLLEGLGRAGHRLTPEESRALCEHGLPWSLSMFERVLDPVVAESVLPSWIDSLGDDVFPYEVARWMPAPAGTLAARAFSIALGNQRVHARYAALAWRVPVCFDQWMGSPGALDARSVVRALEQDEQELVTLLSRHPSRREELARRFLLPHDELERSFGADGLLQLLTEALAAEKTRSKGDDAARAARRECVSWIHTRRERNEPVVGLVHSRVKGGLSVLVGPARCFLPGSQTMLPAERHTELVGKALSFRVLKGTSILTLRDVPEKPALQYPVMGVEAVIDWPVDGDTIGLLRTLASWGPARRLRERALRVSGLLADRAYHAWCELDERAALAWAMAQPIASLSEEPRAHRLHEYAPEGELRQALSWSAPARVRTAALEAIRHVDGATGRFSEEIRSLAWRTRASSHDDLSALGMLAASGDRSALRALVDVIENERDSLREEISFDCAFPRRAPDACERELLLRILDHRAVGPDAAERLVRGGNADDLDAVLQRALVSACYAHAFRAR